MFIAVTHAVHPHNGHKGPFGHNGIAADQSRRLYSSMGIFIAGVVSVSLPHLNYKYSDPRDLPRIIITDI
jgi:hypothetical protein